jgi:hypothetical protein
MSQQIDKQTDRIHGWNWSLVNRIPFIGQNRFTVDENKLFAGSWYPEMESEEFWTGWQYDQKSNESTRRLVKQRFYCDLPIKPSAEQDAATIAKIAAVACLQFGIHFLSPIVLREETVEGKRHNPGPITYDN